MSDFTYPLPTKSPDEGIEEYIPLLLSAVDAELGRREAWEDDDADAALGYMEDLKQWLMVNLVPGDDVALPVGSIIAYAGAVAPTGYLLCDGSAVSRTTYADLFAVLSTTYGAGDGLNTFNLPDFRGRTPIGAGTGSGLAARSLGQTVGAETHALTISEMPAHDHFTYPTAGTGGTKRTFAVANTTGQAFSTEATSSSGSGSPHNNMQPSLVVNFLIRAVT